MVRFENLIYERLLNIKLLGRNRQLASPRKWFNEPRHDAVNAATERVFTKSAILAPLLRLLEPLIAKASYQWIRDIALQRGLAMEDFFVHKDRELRRCYFFETVQRQACHPYQWLLFKRRRARYYKVERGLRGVYVPEYIRQEAESRLLADTVKNREDWQEFIYQNYVSDMTPCTRPSIIPKLIPLELFNQYKLFSNDGWERYFFNEVNYGRYPTDGKGKQGLWKLQLNDQVSKKNFEDEVNRFIRLYPGAVVREGEKFDFEGFYAKLAQGKPNQIEQTGVEKLTRSLREAVKDKKEKHQKKLGVVVASNWVRETRKSLFLS